MSWISITLATLYEDKVAALVDACDSAALGEGQANRSAAVIQGVVDDIRRKVESCRTNRVDSDLTTIPKGLRNIAATMILARLKNSIEQALTDDERNELKKCETDLNRIANCDDVVDQPDDPIPSTAEPAGGTPGITGKCRKFTRHDQRGI